MKKFFHLGILSISNISLLFAFQYYLFYRLGAGSSTDAYFAGMTLTSVVITIVGTSLSHVLVPFLAGENDKKMREDTWTFFYLVATLFLILASILYATANCWVPMILPGLNKISTELAIKITRIQLIAMIFISVNAVQSAFCRAKEKFVWLELTAIISNAISFFILIIFILYGK